MPDGHWVGLPPGTMRKRGSHSRKNTIGQHIYILHQMTINQREPTLSSAGQYPEIGDDVYTGTGVKSSGRL